MYPIKSVGEIAVYVTLLEYDNIKVTFADVLEKLVNISFITSKPTKSGYDFTVGAVKAAYSIY